MFASFSPHNRQNAADHRSHRGASLTTQQETQVLTYCTLSNRSSYCEPSSCRIPKIMTTLRLTSQERADTCATICFVLSIERFPPAADHDQSTSPCCCGESKTQIRCPRLLNSVQLELYEYCSSIKSVSTRKSRGVDKQVSRA